MLGAFLGSAQSIVWTCKSANERGHTKIAGTSFAQKSLLVMPYIVTIKKIKPRKSKNSSHVKGLEREVLVAGMRMDLMKLTGKKWTKYPRIVCNVASAFTSKGFTYLTPAFLLSSRVISSQAKNSQSSMLSSVCGTSQPGKYYM